MAERPPEQEEAKRIAERFMSNAQRRNLGFFPDPEDAGRLARAHLALLAAYEDRSKAFEDAAADCVRLEGELEPLREALAFYANPETYFAIGIFPDPPCGEFMDDFEELSGPWGHPDGGTWTKPGKRARAAIGTWLEQQVEGQHAHAEHLREAREHQEEKHGE